MASGQGGAPWTRSRLSTGRCPNRAAASGSSTPTSPKNRGQVLRSDRPRGAACASACVHHHDPPLAQSRRGRARRAGPDDDGHAARRHHLAPARQHRARRHGASVRRRARRRPPCHPRPSTGEQSRHQPRPVCRRLRGHRPLAGGPRSLRPPAADRVPRRPRAGAERGQDPHRPHRRRVRLPRLQPQALSQWQAAGPAPEGEGRPAPRAALHLLPGQPAAEHGRGDQAAVPGDPGLVQLLPLRGGQAHVRQPGPSRLADHLQMGPTPPSHEEPALGSPPLLRRRSGPRLGPCGTAETGCRATTKPGCRVT